MNEALSKIARETAHEMDFHCSCECGLSEDKKSKFILSTGRQISPNR